MNSYGEVLHRLLPPGRATRGKNLKKLCNALGKEFFRVDSALKRSLNETPGQLEDNIEDWERVLGIEALSHDSRAVRNARIVAKLSPIDGHSIRDYQNFVERITGVRPYVSFHAVLKSGFFSGQRCFGKQWLFVVFLDGIPPAKIGLVEELLLPYKQSHSVLLLNKRGTNGES